MAAQRILVTLSTGKQGSAVVDAILSQSTTARVLAVTRSAQGGAAKALAAKSDRISLVQGTWEDAPALFRQSEETPDALVITTFFEPGKKSTEVAEGTALIDAAIAASVPHIVLLSVDRGGEAKSDTTPTDVPHFATKYDLEKILFEKTKQAKVPTTWTVIRPVAFCDNLTADFMGKGFTSMWLTALGDRPLQLVSCRDIGRVAAKSLLDAQAYAGRKISLAGDSLTIAQARTAFREAIGTPLPETFSIVGSAIRMLSFEMRVMFSWFRTDGYGADVAGLRKEFPDLQDFKTWLREDSPFKSVK